MLKTLGLLLLLLIFCVGVAVGYFNDTPVKFDYLVGSVDIQLVVLLLLVFAFAVVLTVILCGIRMLGQHAQIRRLRRQLRESETELKNLRSLPVKDQ